LTWTSSRNDGEKKANRVSGEMPITPFHVGPGLLVKAAAPGHFSLCAFAAVQVVIDTEVVVNVIRGHNPLHGFFHTWIGSLLVGACCAGLLLLAAPGVRRFLSAKNLNDSVWPFLFQDFTPISILTGTFIGALSHVALDGFLYPELKKPWLDLIDMGTLQWYCLLAGLAGVFWIIIGWVLPSKSSGPDLGHG
jgi:hypothetical protein